MTRLLFGLLLCLSPAASELTTATKATVEGRLTTELPLESVRVVLNGGAYTAIPRLDGSFKLHAVAPGSYLLEVLDTQSVWPTVRLDVSATSGKARALLTHSRQPLPFPLPLEPLVAKPTFFEKREGFNWAGMLMNPMVLMMGFTLLIMVVFPKMMENMDPEQLKEMQQMQGGLTDMLNPEKAKEKLEQTRKELESKGAGGAPKAGAKARKAS
eukprot:CAMPEP_0115847724 /NCGR_PEP_ID=MMETSP0287-20121206/10535_1 /TAXON_ID=412157 /ORGANISM="Chrysochromulina rotalis, Strain UIO044" /LENGTH=212 /DNA_ID=CAMNT_0003301577 /DNA_START=13 /DNA_END=651 /DNA_ORIENTATION=-